MTAADAAMVCAALLAGVGAWAAVREIDRLRLRVHRETDLADGRLRMLVREREEHAADQLAAQQEVETLRRQLHEAVEESRHLRRERDEARSRVRWVRRQDPPAGADARLLRVVVGQQAALLTEERLAEGHRRAEIVAGAWEDER